MEDKRIFETIKSEVDKTDIPENLKPENVINMLGEQIEDERYASVDVQEANCELNKANILKKSKFKALTMTATGIAAAVFLMLVGVHVVYNVANEINSEGTHKCNENDIISDLDMVTDVDGFLKFEDYAQLKSHIEKIGYKPVYDNGFGGENVTVAVDGVVDETLEQETIGVNDYETEDYEPGYSDTTIRTEGVLEADCIKTDGEYIYSLKGDLYDVFLNIAKADGENTEYVGRYNISGLFKDNYSSEEEFSTFSINDMLLYGQKIIILGSFHDDVSESDGYKSIISIWDISDVTNVVHEKSFTIEGTYNQCRMKEGYLYVLTNCEINMDNLAPTVDEEKMDCSDIYVSDCTYYNSYSIFTTYNLNDEPELINSMAVVSNTNTNLYVSTNNIYMLSTDWKSTEDNEIGQNYLSVMKYSYSEGVITAVATAEIEGWLDDTFCIDEYNDYLRIVVTSYTETYDRINTLYVFDNSLDITGKITDIAPGESIYSARFEGDIGYFVTFKQVDPLFSVDLSDPTNPQIIGELKIPGFSEFMFAWGNGKMLGIGEENNYLKLSMFDVSDPANVTEEDKTILEGIYYSSALYNYKALLVDANKNLIGFFAEGISLYERYDTDDSDKVELQYDFAGKYYLYSYEDGKFTSVADIVIEYDKDTQVRGMYIDDYIYIVSTYGTINVISMDTYEIVKTIELN